MVDIVYLHRVSGSARENLIADELENGRLFSYDDYVEYCASLGIQSFDSTIFHDYIPEDKSAKKKQKVKHTLIVD